MIENGIVCFTFDDRHFKGWLDALPLFAKYGAHATFFFAGEINQEALETMKALKASGHTVGLHTLNHADAPAYFEAHGEEAYIQNEILPQLSPCLSAGIKVQALAYPNNLRTAKTDAVLSRYFTRYRAGVRGASEEEIFVPVSLIGQAHVMHGTGIGAYYHTEWEPLRERLCRVAESNTCATFFSHNIAQEADSIHMPTALLNACLAECQRLGIRVLGFDELP